jgi:hypothetical protein
MLHVGNFYSADLFKILPKYKSMYLQDIFFSARILLEEAAGPATVASNQQT